MRTLITGAAQGIGLAVAQRLARDGARLCLFDRKGLDAALGALGCDTAIAVEGDVLSERDVEDAVVRLISAFGGIDCVVNAAGITRVEPALTASVENVRNVMEVNVLGSFLPSQRAARHMAEAGKGSIVMLGSVYGVGGAPERTAYCASKGAVHNLVHSLATEWGPLGIRVNAVAPTGVRTPMVQDLIDRGLYDLAGVCGRAPLGRLAEPEEVAEAIAFLAGDAAAMINGAILPVDGGWTANGYVAKRA